MANEFDRIHAKHVAKGGASGVTTRLAASEVNSAAAIRISNDDAGYENTVKQKLMANYGLNGSDAQKAYDGMIQKLQDSELIIHFRPADLFRGVLTNSYQNLFERSPQGSGISDREYVEDRLFEYSSIDSTIESIMGTNTNARDVIDRISKAGNYQRGGNPSFDPSIRPKYAAINLFDLRGVPSLTMYGHSYLVLKDYVKHRCTFTDGDSLLPGQPGLSNMLHMGALLNGLEDAVLDALYLKSRGEDIDSSNTLITHYLMEAQIHSEILLNRDVAKIYLCNFELNQGNQEDNMQILKGIGSFLGKNKGITVEYFD